MNTQKLIIASLVIVMATGCSKKEESATDILATVEIPKKVEILKVSPPVLKTVEPIKVEAPAPSIAKVETIAPVVPAKPIIPLKEVVQAPVPQVKPIAVKVAQPIVKPATITAVVSKPPLPARKEKVIYSVEFE